MLYLTFLFLDISRPVIFIFRSSGSQVLQNRWSEKFWKISRKAPVPVSFLIKLLVSSQQLYEKKRLWHRCSPVKFLRNTSGRHFLYFFIISNRYVYVVQYLTKNLCTINITILPISCHRSLSITLEYQYHCLHWLRYFSFFTDIGINRNIATKWDELNYNSTLNYYLLFNYLFFYLLFYYYLHIFNNLNMVYHHGKLIRLLQSLEAYLESVKHKMERFAKTGNG